MNLDTETFIGLTGATIKKGNSSYKVIYKEHLIFESKAKGVALVLALNKNECENRLTLVLNSV